MKRWLWLLAMPYVVTGSTGTWREGNSLVTGIRRVGTMQCEGTLEECEDLAEALNAAHERRTGILTATQTWHGWASGIYER